MSPDADDPAPATFAGPNTNSLTLILASASASRRRLLANAGVAVEAVKAAVDEDSAKASLRADGAAPDAIADTLAEMKAMRVSGKYPEAMVIGADQVLALEGAVYDKPADRERAHAHLAALQGRSHVLVTSTVIVRGGERIWGHTYRATLHMRPLSDATIAHYLDAVGDKALESVGAYQLEGLGAHLFTRVEGDFFTILGLPLLPLLGFLRQHGLVPA
jgi:septum formation protein